MVGSLLRAHAGREIHRSVVGASIGHNGFSRTCSRCGGGHWRNCFVGVLLGFASSGRRRLAVCFHIRTGLRIVRTRRASGGGRLRLPRCLVRSFLLIGWWLSGGTLLRRIARLIFLRLCRLPHGDYWHQRCNVSARPGQQQKDSEDVGQSHIQLCKTCDSLSSSNQLPRILSPNRRCYSIDLGDTSAFSF